MKSESGGKSNMQSGFGGELDTHRSELQSWRVHQERTSMSGGAPQVVNSTAGGVDKGTPREVPYSTRGRRETCLDDVSPADGVTPQRRLERIAARGPTASQRRSDVFLPRTYPRSKHTPASSLTLLPRVTRDPTHRPRRFCWTAQGQT